MKYSLFLLQNMLPEWREAYIDYKNLKKLFGPLKFLTKSTIKSLKNRDFCDSHIEDPLIPADKQYYLEIVGVFFTSLKNEVLKFTKFFEFQVFQSREQWRNLLINIEIHSNSEKNLEKTKMLRDVFHQFYIKLHYLSKFQSLNIEIINVIMKKFYNISLAVHQQLNIDFVDSEKLLKSTKFNENLEQLEKLTSNFKNIYKSTFYTPRNRHVASKILKKITQEKQISRKESYFCCFFAGVSFFLLAFIVIFAIDGQFDDLDTFFNHIFPIFRGASFIILYIWLLAWNVHGWNKFNINYRRIFKFNHHYSTLSQILKRCMFFTAVFLITFLWYVLIKSKLGSFSDILDFLPEKKCIASIIWIILLCYMFFPSKKYCNGQGRIYVYRLFRKILCLSCFNVDFCVNWATDQLVSFVTPLKDLEYTLCFYVVLSNDNDMNEMTQLCSEKTIYIGFAAASMPLFYRMIQCMRLLKQNWKKKEYYIDIFNFFKYFSSLLVAIFSFMAGMTSQTTVLSTIYSYIWDIKMDWGLLKTRNLLREKLLYDKKYYYLAIVVNFLFRCSWVMTISNGVNPFGMQKEVFNLIFGFIEMLRRSIWNFMRVEKEYIFNTNLYKLYEDIRLPYEIKKENINSHKQTNINDITNNERNSSTVILKKRKNNEQDFETFAETYIIDFKTVEEESLRIEFEVMKDRSFDLNRLSNEVLSRKSIRDLK